MRDGLHLVWFSAQLGGEFTADRDQRVIMNALSETRSGLRPSAISRSQDVGVWDISTHQHLKAAPCRALYEPSEQRSWQRVIGLHNIPIRLGQG